MRGVGSRIRWWQGLYVRVNIGNTSSGERRYLVCEVLGIRDKATEYQVPTPLSVCEVMSKRRALGPVLGARGSCAPCDAGGHSGREGRLAEGRLGGYAQELRQPRLGECVHPVCLNARTTRRRKSCSGTRRKEGGLSLGGSDWRASGRPRPTVHLAGWRRARHCVCPGAPQPPGRRVPRAASVDCL